MQDPDLKCRHFGILWHFGIFAKKSNKKSNPIFLILSDFFRFLDFSRLSNSTALMQTHFQIIQTFFRFTKPNTIIFQIFQIHFLDYPDTFQIVRKLSISSGHFVYDLDILYCKVSGYSSANNELVAKTFRICKNFLVSIADALTGFLRLCRRLTNDVGE